MYPIRIISKYWLVKLRIDFKKVPPDGDFSNPTNPIPYMTRDTEISNNTKLMNLSFCSVFIDKEILDW